MAQFWDREEGKPATRFNLYGRDTVRYPRTGTMVRRSRLAHTFSPVPGARVGSAAAKPELTAARPPPQLPPRRHMKSVALGEPELVHLVCNAAKLLLLLLFISTRWHQRGFFPSLYPLPVSILPRIRFLGPEYIVHLLS